MNNRQSGRRRGRNNNSNNNNRSQSGGRGGVDQANRIDSRARGNGAQMIEKYRNLARDAQLAGDRVQTEYYLQFADHYFRVVSDFRARQEERSAQGGQDRGPDRQREIRGVEDFDGHDESDIETDRDDGDNDGHMRSGRDRDRRDEGEGRGESRGEGRRGDRPQQGRSRRERDTAEQAGDGDDGEGESVAEEQAPAPRGARRGARRPRAAEADEGHAAIDSSVLPPAIGRVERDAEPDTKADDAGDAPAPKARRPRRTLAARNDGVEAAE